MNLAGECCLCLQNVLSISISSTFICPSRSHRLTLQTCRLSPVATQPQLQLQVQLRVQVHVRPSAPADGRRRPTK